MDQVPKMPAFMEKQARLSIEDANETPRLNNIEDDNVTVQRMLDLMKKSNYLQQSIEENGWARNRAIWILLSDFGLPDFPRLTWKCKVCARVVGCCLHVAFVIWYLGYWRHNHTQTKTSSLGYTDTLQDAAKGWSSDDSVSESQKET
ncbi:hypothetical protein TNCV_2758941 [Trichonephila clavipes]|nr:hypothetical protein TNCV_2758941 [Trichonephila clavipes]